VDANVHSKGVVIASGLSTFRKDTDSDYQHMFERADKRMYQRKAELKAM
jgi:PleD family two-component response regulator